MEVTRARGSYWRDVTGRTGRWVIPDWEAVSREYDGVHLTFTGYLSCAGAVVSVDDECATTTGGWNPDETRWLTNAVVPDGPVTEWVYWRSDVDSNLDEWRPVE